MVSEGGERQNLDACSLDALDQVIVIQLKQFTPTTLVKTLAAVHALQHHTFAPNAIHKEE